MDPPGRVLKQTKENAFGGLRDRSGRAVCWLVGEGELGEGSPKSAEKTPGIK